MSEYTIFSILSECVPTPDHAKEEFQLRNQSFQSQESQVRFYNYHAMFHAKLFLFYEIIKMSLHRNQVQEIQLKILGQIQTVKTSNQFLTIGFQMNSTSG